MAMNTLLSVMNAASAVAAASSTASAPSTSRVSMTTPRQLQAANGATYSYIDDVSGYALRYSSCLRVKIPQDNDDDAVDGNVNFYNGRYHAQYQVFATFHVCGDGNYGSDQCSAACDYGTEYAMGVDDYLDTQMNHWGNYCDNCQAACGGRKLDDAAVEVNCNTCANDCMNFYKGGDDGNDESAYLECADGGQDEDGLQMYYGPQCSDDGQIVIGVFYDDECTIKTKHDSPQFDYYKFGTVTSGCVDCSTEDGQESCNDLYGEAYHCLNGKDQQGKEDDMKVCSAVQKSLSSIDYSGIKKRHSGADKFLKIFFGLLVVGFVGGFFFLTWTYYVRHRGEKNQPILNSQDVHEESAEQAHGGGTLT